MEEKQVMAYNALRVKGLYSKEEFSEFAAAFSERPDVHLVANMTEFGKGPLLLQAELGTMGYSLVIYPVTLFRAAMKAVEATLHDLMANGSNSSFEEVIMSRSRIYELLKYTP